MVRKFLVSTLSPLSSSVRLHQFVALLPPILLMLFYYYFSTFCIVTLDPPRCWVYACSFLDLFVPTNWCLWTDLVLTPACLSLQSCGTLTFVIKPFNMHRLSPAVCIRLLSMFPWPLLVWQFLLIIYILQVQKGALGFSHIALVSCGCDRAVKSKISEHFSANGFLTMARLKWGVGGGHRNAECKDCSWWP